MITQADLAARLQIEGLRLERVTILKIETGYREVADMETVAIAKALGVTVNWLLGKSEESKANEV